MTIGVVSALSAIRLLDSLGSGLREAFSMFWETLWALILGFTLSGVVQAMVPRETMRSKLGRLRRSSVLRASSYGMVSSSCSYAASAMARSLVAKGADFTSAMIFMFASTNLVVELGLVMLVLLGWQFTAAEFTGGPIMIVLLALLGGAVFSGPLVTRVIARLRASQVDESSKVQGHDHHDQDSALGGAHDHHGEVSASNTLRSPSSWAEASSYAVADAKMLRRELAIGYVVAGILAVMVPAHLWSALFWQGHGIWTSIENALVGPLIAVASWVCSIGNVPLAAALWSGGISFGGVIAFIFADLIAMPLILIYAKFYGWRLALRMVAVFYVVMVVAGLATELLFTGLRAVPPHRSVTVAVTHFEWNYTTFLNIAFLVVAAGVWWLARNKGRFGGGESVALDPVCGMQVTKALAPARLVHDDAVLFFCSERCQDRFSAGVASPHSQVP